jgi:KUP system potassium uptake protein
VLPALMLNYMGQGAMVLSMDAAGREAIKDPFF